MNLFEVFFKKNHIEFYEKHLNSHVILNLFQDLAIGNSLRHSVPSPLEGEGVRRTGEGDKALSQAYDIKSLCKTTRKNNSSAPTQILTPHPTPLPKERELGCYVQDDMVCVSGELLVSEPSPEFLTFASAQVEILPSHKERGGKSAQSNDEKVTPSHPSPALTPHPNPLPKARGRNAVKFGSGYRKAAFTLAEVLITLGIIGIVAAMTLPSLMAHINDVQLRSQTLKSYSTLQQAIKKMEADDIPIQAPKGSGNKFFYLTLKDYINNAVDCGASTRGGQGGQGCYLASYGNYYAFQGNSIYPAYRFDDGQLLLADGTLLMFENPIGSENPPLWIFVDVNGFKKLPNRLGQDVFVFQMTDEGLLPMGAKGTDYEDDADFSKFCNKKKTSADNGMSCAEKMLKDPKYYEWVRKVGD